MMEGVTKGCLFVLHFLDNYWPTFFHGRKQNDFVFQKCG